MTSTKLVPSYSAKGLAARDIFYSGIIDTHFFVEDEDQENLYFKILSRVFPKLSKFKVFPLNGKKSVLSHAKNAKPLGRVKRIYILDKDFDDLLGKMRTESDIFYLDDYCIENVLIEEESLLHLAIEERPRLRRSTVKSRLAFEATLASWLPLLDRLHRAFFLVQDNDLGIENCDCAPEKFTIRGKASVLDEDKINAYIGVVAMALVNKLIITEPDDIEPMLNSAFGSRRVNYKHINGKFLIKLFFHYLKAADLMGNVRTDSMVFRLASNTSFKKLRSFRRRVNIYLRA